VANAPAADGIRGLEGGGSQSPFRADLLDRATPDPPLPHRALRQRRCSACTAPGTVIALKATDGTELWSHTTTGYVFSSPAVVNGVVYVGSGDDGLYALMREPWTDAFA
jgi:hypothetical protein